MDETSQKLAKIDYYVKLVLKRRWLVIIPFCLAMMVGIYLAITLPKVYRASSLIMVVPKTVPDDFVPSLQATDTQERINTIKQQILSRSNLEKIINDFDIYSEPEFRHLYLEDKVDLLRRRVHVNVTKSGRGVDSFRIAFRGERPRKVAAVANALANRFIDESISVIMEEVLETNQFLEGELDDLREELQTIEARIQNYRRENMGELPEQLDSNLRTIDRLQLQLSEEQATLRESRNRLAELDVRISGLRAPTPVAVSNGDGGPAENGEILDPTAPPAELVAARQKLKEMMGRYTEKHPDIIQMKTVVAEMEAAYRDRLEELARQAPAPTDASPPPGENAVAAQGAEDAPPVQAPKAIRNSSEINAYQQARLELLAQRETTRKEIAQTLQDIRKIESQIEVYQEKVEKASKHEIRLLELQRNYDNLQGSYKSLLERKLESDIAVNLEKKQKGQSFKVIDQAKVPQRPFSPNMKKLLAFCVAAGLGIGGGVIFLLDLLDRSLKIPQDAERQLGVPILATVPRIIRPRDRFRHRINQAMSFLFAVMGLGLLSLLALMSLRGVEQTLDVARKIM